MTNHHSPDLRFAPEFLSDVIDAMHDHEHGSGACVIGRVTAEHPGVVVANTSFGVTRVIDLPLGEQSSRIC